MRQVFRHFADQIAVVTGSPVTFAIACGIVALWLASGPLFGFSDTWQLLINTSTTIVTNLLVILLQNTQNRNDRATHVKLDEIIRATGPARNAVINLEHCSDEELVKWEEEFSRVKEARSAR